MHLFFRPLRSFARLAVLLLGSFVPALAQLPPIVWTVTSPQGLSAWSENIDALAFGAGRFVAAGSVTGVVNGARIAYSNDLVAWTDATLPAGIPSTTFGQDYFLRSAAYGNGMFIIGAWGSPVANTQKVLTSTDGGATWTRRDVRLGHVWGLDFLNGTWFATGDSGNNTSSLSTSPDGITWTSRATGSADDLYGVAFGNNLYVAVGNGSQVVTSPDGVTWTRRTVADSGASIHDIVFAAGRFVACAYGGILYTSTDGLAWTKIDTGTGSNARFESIAYGNGRFVAVGNNTSVSSADGLAWIVDSTNLRLTTDIVYGAGVFAVGAGIGTVYRSGTPTFAGPVITAQPQDGSAVAGGSAVFSVTATGSNLAYQWRRNGTVLAGATAASLTLTGSDVVAGTYQVTVTNADGTAVSRAATLTLVSASAAGRLVNMSIRTGAGTGDATLIVGLGLGGAGTSGNKAVLLRAVGPTLAGFGVGGALADPVMTVFQGTTQVESNDDWTASAGATFAGLGAFAFAAGSRDSAIYGPDVPSGSYSIQITGKAGATGIALAEIYDATAASAFTVATPRLVNVSARTHVGTGDNLLIAGFVVGGSTPVRVLIRAVGPTLAGFGVGGALADPKLDVFSGASVVASNDNWDAATAANFSRVGAFAFAAGSRDAALVATLPPGSYTAQVSGVNSTTGVALVEVYELP